MCRYRIYITLISDKDAYYSPLYYMPKQDVCQTCPDFVPFGNECSDAGDCWRGFCACDTGYTGYKCQESRKFIFKGQIISECPYEKIVCPKIATKIFPRFLSCKFTTSRLTQKESLCSVCKKIDSVL